jgi:hypothetical protein
MGGILNKRFHDQNPDPGDHPMKAEDITEENFRNIADGLFNEQAKFTADYLVSMAENGYSDDDTDYLRSALNATERLMDLAYDHNRDDLVAFLYTPRDFERTTVLHLSDMLSAGGLCDSLNSYEEMIYMKEDLTPKSEED